MSREAPNGSTTIVAVDTGGTFTDVVALDGSGGIRTAKVPSTPDDPARAILAGVRKVVPPGDPFVLLHGSTVATNALLERTGGDVLLVTNEGFEDVLEIGRQDRAQLYAFHPTRPTPLVPRTGRVGVPGRLGPDGEEVHPLDRGAVEALLDRAAAADAVAVVLLHSYAEAAHERAVAEILAPSGTPISLSVDILPEFREYERTATTVVNAYVQPVMTDYLGRLEAAVEGEAERVQVMSSGGGLLPVARAAREPVQTVLSGPAGGVVGALRWGRAVGRTAIVTFDMGGTSTDVSLCPGQPLRTREFEIAGLPVAVPVLDIHTVGAGGGSIAEIDAGGALRVGPRSAGAEPGPICYGRGGREVTVTDAHLWLGRIPADALLGGEHPLDRAAVEEPLRELARRLGTTPEGAAEGILEVATTTMERALRVISVERGFDPADLALVAFGGAGALHAAELATRLGCAEALVPPASGLLSAWGILSAAPTRERSSSVLSDTGDDGLGARLDVLAEEARRELLGEGVPAADIAVDRRADLRYRGQSFELTVDARGAPDAWAERFHEEHLRRYGYAHAERTVEVVTLRTIACGADRDLPDQSEEESDAGPGTPFRGSRVHTGGEWREAPVHRRATLVGGAPLEGPAIVLDDDATVWVPGGYRASLHRSGVLRLRRGAD